MERKKGDMNIWTKRALVAGSVFLLLGMAYGKWVELHDTRIVLVRFPDGTQVTAEVVSTPEDHAQGLSGRASLDEDEGMLFDFPSAEIREFWMKDMLFPIDIIWLHNGVIVDLDRDVPAPASGEAPVRLVPSDPVSQVLELPAGFIEAHHVLKRDVLTLSVP
jgi:uncharacterized membrane protein (UPF0127 family)